MRTDHEANRQSDTEAPALREAPRSGHIVMVQASKFAPFPPALNLARALPNLGFRFTFVSLADAGQDVAESLGPGSEHVRIGVGRKHTSLGPVNTVAQSVRFLRGLRRVIRGSRADLLLGCWGGGFLATWLAARKGERLRLVFWANEFIRHDELGILVPLRYVILAERLIARRVPLTVVADPARGKPQAAYLGVGDYVAVRNTPSIQPPQPGPSRLADAVAKIRAEAPDAGVFCFAGSICQGAQISRLLASFTLWPANAHLVLVGNVDKDIPDFNGMVQRSGPRVTYLGAMPYGEVERGLPTCDVGVALYNTDWPWSNEIYCAPCKIGDYVKAGLAILVSQNPTLVSLLAEHPVGVAVDPLDPKSIARGASQLMSDRVSGKTTSAMVSTVFRTHLNLETQLAPLLRYVGTLDDPGGGLSPQLGDWSSAPRRVGHLRTAGLGLVRRLPRFRGKGWLLDRLAPTHGLLRRQVFGCEMQLDCGELIQRRIAQGVFEPDSLSFVARILGEGSVFVDAGANIGIYTAVAAQSVGNSGAVVAFEPSAAAFAKLESMVLANGLRQVKAFRIALDRADGDVELFVPPRAYGNLNASLFEYTAGMAPERVTARRLDGVLDGLGISEVDLLKVDVEGKERDLLLGATGCLGAGRVKWVLMELNDRLLQLAGTSAGEIVSLMGGFGYTRRQALDGLNWVFERSGRD